MMESQWYQRPYVGAEPVQREDSEGRPEEEWRDYLQVKRIVLLVIRIDYMYVVDNPKFLNL